LTLNSLERLAVAVSARYRIEREIKTIAGLQHPRSLGLIDSGEQGTS